VSALRFGLGDDGCRLWASAAAAVVLWAAPVLPLGVFLRSAAHADALVSNVYRTDNGCLVVGPSDLYFDFTHAIGLLRGSARPC